MALKTSQNILNRANFNVQTLNNTMFFLKKANSKPIC